MSQTATPHARTKERKPVVLSVRGRKDAFIQAFSMLGNIRMACQAAEIDRRTYYRWIENDPDFVQRKQFAQQDYGDRLEAKCAELALRQDNVRALELALKMSGRLVETTRNEHTHSGPGGNPIQVSVQALIADIDTAAERVLLERSGAFVAPALGSGDLESSESEDASG